MLKNYSLFRKWGKEKIQQVGVFLLSVTTIYLFLTRMGLTSKVCTLILETVDEPGTKSPPPIDAVLHHFASKG